MTFCKKDTIYGLGEQIYQFEIWMRVTAFESLLVARSPEISN